jgi:hypothetical protein
MMDNKNKDIEDWCPYQSDISDCDFYNGSGLCTEIPCITEEEFDLINSNKNPTSEEFL